MFELVLFASHPATVNHYEEPSSRCLLQGYRKDSTAKALTVTPGTHTAVDLLDGTSSALVFCLSDRLEQTQHGPPHAFYPCPQRFVVFSQYALHYPQQYKQCSNAKAIHRGGTQASAVLLQHLCT